jgi:hemoglobin
MDETTVYERVGGDEFFRQLVEAFYDRVERDEILRPMYPEDLTESKRTLELFLVQYWGGPRTYLDERGHPRLRMRHAPFRITKRARDAWLTAMTGALEEVAGSLDEEVLEEFREYFSMAATSLRNV